MAALVFIIEHIRPTKQSVLSTGLVKIAPSKDKYNSKIL